METQYKNTWQIKQCFTEETSIWKRKVNELTFDILSGSDTIGSLKMSKTIFWWQATAELGKSKYAFRSTYLTRKTFIYDASGKLFTTARRDMLGLGIHTKLALGAQQFSWMNLNTALTPAGGAWFDQQDKPSMEIGFDRMLWQTGTIKGNENILAEPNSLLAVLGIFLAIVR